MFVFTAKNAKNFFSELYQSRVKMILPWRGRVEGKSPLPQKRASKLLESPSGLDFSVIPADANVPLRW